MKSVNINLAMYHHFTKLLTPLMLLMNQLNIETRSTKNTVKATRSTQDTVNQSISPLEEQKILNFFQRLRLNPASNVKYLEDPSNTGSWANQLLKTQVVYFDKRKKRQILSHPEPKQTASKQKRQFSILSVARKMMKKTEQKTVSDDKFRKLQKIGYFLTRILKR